MRISHLKSVNFLKELLIENSQFYPYIYMLQFSRGSLNAYFYNYDKIYNLRMNIQVFLCKYLFIIIALLYQLKAFQEKFY